MDQLKHLRKRLRKANAASVPPFAVGQSVTHCTEGTGTVIAYARLTGMGAVNARPYRVQFHRLAGYALVWCAAEDLKPVGG